MVAETTDAASAGEGMGSTVAVAMAAAVAAKTEASEEARAVVWVARTGSCPETLCASTEQH